MIIRQSANPHICQICQLNPKRLKSPFFVQSVFKSIEALGQSNEQHKSLITRVPTEKFPDNSHSSFTQSRYDIRDAIYGSIGRKLVGNVERIEGRDGKSANIIVLRNSVLFTYVEEDRGKAEEKPHPPFNLIDPTENKETLVDSQEVNKYIEKIRPKEELLEDWEDFNVLVDELSNGFTVTQLQEYMKKFQQKKKNKKVPKSTPVSDEQLLSSITPWWPGISNAQNHFDTGLTRGYRLESRTSKQRLAARLMLECWNLEVASIIEGPGQFEIELGAASLEVLLSGNPPPLQIFNDRILTMEGEGLEVFRFRKTLRITSTKTRMHHIVKEMEDLVKIIEIRNISLSNLMPASSVKQLKKEEIDQWVSSIFDDKALAKIKRLTGVTVLRYSNSDIVLASLPKGSCSRESPIDTACRLLLNARPPVSPKTYSLASADESMAAPINYCNVQVMNWWCRTRPWFRWVAPIPKEEENPVTAPIAESPIRYICSGYEDVKNQLNLESMPSPALGDKASLNSQILPKLVTATFATLGAVIHTHTDPNSQEIPSVYRNQKNTITEFSSHVPNVTLLLSHAEFDKKARMEERVVLRFLPNLFTKNFNVSKKDQSKAKVARYALPHIELNFRMDRKRKAKYAFAKAVVNESQTDVMLPQETIDLRFHQQTTSNLPDESSKPINSFIQKCKLDLNPGGNITIPPSIKLPIPVDLCQKKELTWLQNSRGTKFKLPTKPNGLINNVEYLFSSLEVRRRLVFKYESWNLEYTYIDAGKSGGTRGELSLRPIKDGKGVSDQEFINFALELACRVTSLSTPDMTRFRGFTKVQSPLVRRYVPTHQPMSDYPRNFLYIPRRILCDSTPDHASALKSHENTLTVFEEQARAFEDELDDFEMYCKNNLAMNDLDEQATQFQPNKDPAENEVEKSPHNTDRDD